MPSNIISINGIAEFYVSDSKMRELLKWLNKNGSPHNKMAENMVVNVLGDKPRKRGK
ncbi:MAG: hypothetical protein ACTSPV_00465 [Candidatus Hodarchaeales archaeon]